MRRLRSFLGLIVQNAGWKVLSLAIALVVWALVANEPELSTFATVGVEYKNLPEQLEISSDPVSTVKLELRGPAGELRGIRQGGVQPEVVLDMSKVMPGERTFPIVNGTVKLTRGVRLIRAIPSEVRFRFEQRSDREVRVFPRFSERSGFAVVDFTVTPETVTVEGPTSRVARLERVLTDLIDIPAQEGTFEDVVNTFVDDPFLRFPNVSRVTVKLTVERK